jgi:hypothetical protein
MFPSTLRSLFPLHCSLISILYLFKKEVISMALYLVANIAVLVVLGLVARFFGKK